MLCTVIFLVAIGCVHVSSYDQVPHHYFRYNCVMHRYINEILNRSTSCFSESSVLESVCSSSYTVDMVRQITVFAL